MILARDTSLYEYVFLDTKKDTDSDDSDDISDSSEFDTGASDSDDDDDDTGYLTFTIGRQKLTKAKPKPFYDSY